MGQVFSYIWRCMHPKLPKLDDTRTVLQDDQLNQFEQQSHYITIPDGDTTLFVPYSNSDVVPSNQTYSVIPQVPSIAVDLSDADEKNDKEEGVKVIQVLVQKDVIAEVLATPFKLSGVSREKINRIGPYNSMQRILLVGEGDFSFSASLAVAFGSASNMITTSINSEEFLIKNYRKFVTNKMKLENRGCMVIHGVDATKMLTHSVLGSLRFDCIIFNFPHAGNFGRTDSDVCKNRNLVRGFLTNAKKMIKEYGEIHITHKYSGFFRQWDIPKIGCDQGLYLLQVTRFKRSMYPGYHTMFGFGGDRYFHCNPSKTYKFGIHPT